MFISCASEVKFLLDTPLLHAPLSLRKADSPGGFMKGPKKYYTRDERIAYYEERLKVLREHRSPKSPAEAGGLVHTHLNTQNELLENILRVLIELRDK